MARTTIDFGIDLGTTNSAIAVNDGGTPRVIKNNEGFDYTPSAVWIDRNDRLKVGKEAKDRLEDDPENAFAEFKLAMGFARDYRFQRSGRIMRPEDLSAEVLKSVRGNVSQRMNEDISAAVITIPAAFDVNQREATLKAAQLAGFTTSPLLHEPVAAAFAYGFQNESEKAFWLVYDFGGGTFDAAVVQVQSGAISVINHSGDNNLGGKLIDWAIVQELFIPALLRTANLPDFRRGNPRWRTAIAKLKQDAEEAKIRLSRDTSTQVYREFLCVDDHNQPVSFDFPLHRSDLERLTEPFILRSINTCRQALAEKNLNPQNVAKIVLVGGPTMMPYLRDRLADSRTGLGIPIDFRMDPLTVVAQGAALFAGTQRMAEDASRIITAQRSGAFTISFPQWPFVGSDAEPQVAGMVSAPGSLPTQGYTVEFTNSDAQPPWRSGQIGLAPNGAFLTTLFASRGKSNTFQVVLRDPTGHILPVVTSPEALTYFIGGVLEHTLLTHSVGVALANNEVKWFLEKGASLPARERGILRTAYEVNPGQAQSLLRIPVVEGASPRADRNSLVGKLEVAATQVRRTIPEGSEIEITIEADEAGLVHMKAYIPLLDEEFQEVLHLGGAEATPDLNKIRRDLEEQRARLEKLRGVFEGNVQQIIRLIDDEQIVHQVEVEIGAAQDEPDAIPAAQKRLLALMTALDQAERAAHWPELVAQAENLVSLSHEVVARDGTMHEREAARKCESDIQLATQVRDTDLLEQRISTLRTLVFSILARVGVLQQLQFNQLLEVQSEMRDQARARQLIADGIKAREEGDYHRLGAIDQQLAALLPKPLPPPDINRSTVQ